MKNVLLTIKYDGTNFSGWQKQPSVRTVQGELEKVLGEICCAKIELNGTGRTDAGVHALGQRASFKADFGIPVEKIPSVANKILSDKMKKSDVQILEAKEVSEDFHARFSAKGKEYIYKIYSGLEPNIFRRNQEYQIEKKLDVDSMKKAAAFIEGKNDFKCFQASGGQEKETTVRTIYKIDVIEAKGKDESNSQNILISVKGDGFLYNMVRIIVGTLVEVGQGKIEPNYIKEIIKGQDRTKAGHTAPPWGLYMAEVYFSENEFCFSENETSKI